MADISDLNNVLRAQFAAAEGGTATPVTAADLQADEINTQAPPIPGFNKGTVKQDVVEPVEAAPEPARSPKPAKEVEPDTRMQKVIAQAQQVRAEREAFKREQAQNEADRAELAQLRELKARAKEDPVAWAEIGGFKPDEYAAVLIDKGAVTPERRTAWEHKKQIESLTNRLDQYEAHAAQQTQQNQYNQVMNEMKAFADHSGEAYDLIRRSGDYQRVLTKIDEHYQTTAAMGEAELLPYEQAFEMAEQELFDKVYAPMLDSPKIRGKSTTPSTQSAAPAQRPSGNTSQKMRGASSPPTQMSEAQSLEAAGRMLFKGFPSGR